MEEEKKIQPIFFVLFILEQKKLFLGYAVL